MADSVAKPTDDVIISALLAARTVKDAAEAAGVSESTIRRRMRDSEFAKRLSEASSEVLRLVVEAVADDTAEECRAALKMLGSMAWGYLPEGANGSFELGILGDVPLKHRVRAAEDVLAFYRWITDAEGL